MGEDKALVIGTDSQDTSRLSAQVNGELAPALRSAVLHDGSDWRHAIEAWRDSAMAGRRHRRVVIALLPSPPSATALDDMGSAMWLDRCEIPIILWTIAFGIATTRCADNGAIVAVADRPPPLDISGWGPEAAVSDAVEALARSCARSEGSRGVRANVLTTPSRLIATGADRVAPNPPLSWYPGNFDDQMGPAVVDLLESETPLTGSVSHLDAGRSWR